MMHALVASGCAITAAVVPTPVPDLPSRWQQPSATVSVTRRRSSGAVMGSGVTSNIFKAGFDASWVVDLFGHLQSGLDAAEADLRGAKPVLPMPRSRGSQRSPACMSAWQPYTPGWRSRAKPSPVWSRPLSFDRPVATKGVAIHLGCANQPALASVLGRDWRGVRPLAGATCHAAQPDRGSTA